MTIDYEKLKNRPFDPVEQDYTTDQAILYALGLGFGAEPFDEQQLHFTFEEEGFSAVPTIAVVLAGPGFWVREPDSGVDWVKVLHGEQGIEWHKPMPPSATVIGQTRIVDIIDKGEGKGALIYSEKTLHDKATGDLLATTTSTTFARGDGGFGGPSEPVKTVHKLPDRESDRKVDIAMLPQSALIYRLSGDHNPLHASPTIAKAAGFERPILHGLCTLGVAGRAILQDVCNYDPTRMKSLDLRFSSPVYPGETISTEIWEDDNTISFRARAVERDIVVLNNGKVTIA
jgi:acyl dehydratase